MKICISRRLSALSALALLTACATPEPAPAPMTGPRALVADSGDRQSGSLAHLYYVSKLAGRRIDNAGTATFQATQGRGMALQMTLRDREVAAGETTLTLSGSTTYAAPIQAMLGKTCRVEGDVKFQVLPDQRYTVRGRFDASACAVWLTDSSGAELPGTRVTASGLK
ncbi:MAG: hypothetical protein ACK5O3_12130 [Burkholderiales bacterium]